MEENGSISSNPGSGDGSLAVPYPHPPKPRPASPSSALPLPPLPPLPRPSRPAASPGAEPARPWQPSLGRSGGQSRPRLGSWPSGPPRLPHLWGRPRRGWGPARVPGPPGPPVRCSPAVTEGGLGAPAPTHTVWGPGPCCCCCCWWSWKGGRGGQSPPSWQAASPGAAGRGAPSTGHHPCPQRGGRRGDMAAATLATVPRPPTPGLAAAVGCLAKTRARGGGVTQQSRECRGQPSMGPGTSARARQDPWRVVGRRHGQSTRRGAAGHGQGPVSQGCRGQGTPGDAWPGGRRGTHLVQVDGVEAHLGRGHLGEQRRTAQAAQPRLTQEQAAGRAGEHRAGTRGPAPTPPPGHDTPSPHRLRCPPSLPAPVQGCAEPPSHPQTPIGRTSPR